MQEGVAGIGGGDREWEVCAHGEDGGVWRRMGMRGRGERSVAWVM